MKAEPGPFATIESGGRWTWSAHTLGITTGNFYFAPEILFPTATPRPLIGKGEERRDWDDRQWQLNTAPADLPTAHHCYFPPRQPTALLPF